MIFTVTINLWYVLIGIFAIQTIAFFVCLFTECNIVGSPYFWFPVQYTIMQIIYAVYLLCTGCRYTYNYANLYSEVTADIVGYKKFYRWFGGDELRLVYKRRKDIEENHSDLIRK